MHFNSQSGYKSIAMISNASDRVEAVTVDDVQQTTTFGKRNPSFEEMTKTSVAIIKHIKLAKQTKYRAALDLKRANNTVARDTLLDNVKRKIPNRFKT